ncbi:hypothetical protein [Amycolatopsis sp. lyj-23]|uniref:hypothetical protein n=1 Tax=Amycolatopsis sp. lyj-23 TaxID=2789283 RepID=UPI003979417B
MSAIAKLLEQLEHVGFHGHVLLDRHGEATTVEYRRVWRVRPVADVVLAFGEADAHAYRADERADPDDPFALQWPVLVEDSAHGTLLDVVAVVRSWPAPAAAAPAGDPR